MKKGAFCAFAKTHALLWRSVDTPSRVERESVQALFSD